MKSRPSHEMHRHHNAFRLAERIALRTGERQRVELIPNRRPHGRRWRVVPVEAPAPDTTYDPALFANGVTP